MPDPRFRALQPRVLQSLPPDQLVDAVLDHVFLHQESSGQRSTAALARLPRPVRVIYTTAMLDMEVLNGGFSQFFWNQEEELRLMALEDLEYLGAVEHAAVLRAAIAEFETERDRLLRHQERNTLEAFRDSVAEVDFEAHNQAYYAIGFDALRAFQTSFIVSHIQDFDSGGAPSN